MLCADNKAKKHPSANSQLWVGPSIPPAVSGKLRSALVKNHIKALTVKVNPRAVDNIGLCRISSPLRPLWEATNWIIPLEARNTISK